MPTVRVAIAVLALAVMAPPADAQAPGQCVVTRADGDVVLSARGVARRPAEPGIGLGTGATLRTGASGRVALRCADGLRVVIGPDSEIVLSGLLDGGTRPLGLRLLDGIAGFLLDDSPTGTGSGSGTGTGTGVQIRTPSAVAAVRSTEWAMRVQDAASAVFARSGSVFVATDAGGTVRLGPGDGIDVSAGGVAGEIVRWGQPRIDRIDALLGPGW